MRIGPNMTGDGAWVRLGVVQEGLAETSFMSMFSGGTGAAAGTAAMDPGMAGAVGGAQVASQGAGSSVALGSLQKVLSTATMISAAVGGGMGYASNMAQADAQGLQAQAEAIKIKRELVQKIGAARVAFAGSGLDVSGAAPIESSLVSQGDYEVGLSKNTANMRAAAYRQQAYGSLISAAGTAAKSYADLSFSTARRG